MRSDTYLDRRGIDGFARIQVHTERIKLPLQIKSSYSGKKRFYETWPHYREIVTTIVVKDGMPDEHIRQQLYSGVAVTRKSMTRGSVSVAEFKARITEVLGNRRSTANPALVTQ